MFFFLSGKSAIVAQRMSASLASTGTPSHFVHATEWLHGDLGKHKPRSRIRSFLQVRSNFTVKGTTNKL